MRNKEKTKEQLINEVKLLEKQITELKTSVTKRKHTKKIQSVLFKISEATNSSKTLKELLSIVHQQLKILIEASNFYVALYDEKTGLYSFPYCVDKYDKEDSFPPEEIQKSLTDYVRRTSKPLLADEKVHEKLIRQGEVDMVGAPSKIWLGAPLKSQKGVMGVVVVQSYSDKKVYSNHDLELMTFISGNIALAIERKKAEEELKKHREHLKELIEERTRELSIANEKLQQEIIERKRTEETQRLLSRIINVAYTTDDLKELFQTIQQELSTVLNTENFFVALYNKEDDTIRLPYFVDEINEFQSFPAGKTLTAYVIRNNKSLLVTRDDVKRMVLDGKVEIIGTLSKVWLGVPLKARGEVIGALAVQSYTDEQAFSEKELSILEFVSSHVGLFIERKQVQEKLQESEKHYRNLVENLQEGLLIADPYEDITFANPAFCKTFGYSREEIIGINLSELVPREEFQKMLRETDKREKGISSQYDSMMKCKDGELRKIMVSATPWLDEKDEFLGTIGLILDVTEQKRTEEEKEKLQAQLSQAQKMEAIGRLAGGIAHDFNNLLTAIMGYNDLLLSNLRDNEPLRKDAIEIKKATRQAASLTHQLLAFSRTEPIKPKVLDLNALTANMENMLHRLIGEDIELFTILKPDLGRVEADQGQIEQVIMNLGVNARDAMPEGGRITIKTENVTLNKESLPAIPEAKAGKFVCLSVTDTGVGMDEDTLDLIFEPFFTTKGPKEGTGLGLSTAYGIVKKHKGWINVYSEPGQGSTFKVYLPALALKPEDETIEVISLQELQGSGERILLVEDEKTIRKFATKALRKNGYVVFEAGDAEEALDIFKGEEGRLDLIFTDVVMPGKTGIQLADQLLSLKPELRVLLSSGYTDEKSLLSIIRDRDFQFLQKPYPLDELLKNVKKVIESGQIKT